MPRLTVTPVGRDKLARGGHEDRESADRSRDGDRPGLDRRSHMHMQSPGCHFPPRARHPGRRAGRGPRRCNNESKGGALGQHAVEHPFTIGT